MSLARTDLSFLLDELQHVSVNGTIVSGGQMVPTSQLCASPNPPEGAAPLPSHAMGMEKAGEGKGTEAKLSFPSPSPHADLAVRMGR